VEQLVHWIEKGNIMRTDTSPSLGFLLRGTSDGSKSGGRYLLTTLRSPMVAHQDTVIMIDEVLLTRCFLIQPGTMAVVMDARRANRRYLQSWIIVIPSFNLVEASMTCCLKLIKSKQVNRAHSVMVYHNSGAFGNSLMHKSISRSNPQGRQLFKFRLEC
jgi:hypothetical protein